MLRKPYAAGFYSGASEAKIENFLKDFAPPELNALPVAGLVPHAGWDYSGAVTAKVFRTLAAYSDPKTFVVFGAVHQSIRSNAIYSRGSWATPFGEVLIDEQFADGVLGQAEMLLERDEAAHQFEHSIEVQMPFLKYFFPSAKAVPISVLPDERAVELGRRVGAHIKETGSNTVVIGTTDLTHYGSNYSFAPKGYGPEALEWMKSNDRRIIDLAVAMKENEIISESRRNFNACGPGAVAATVAAAKVLGCTAARVGEYTTSYDVRPERTFQLAVGYVGMIFPGT